MVSAASIKDHIIEHEILGVTSGGGGGSVSDGDKGDIVVSGGGDVWVIDSSAVNASKLASNAVTTGKILDANVTLAKLENRSASVLVGRGSTGAGVPQEISIGTGLSITGTTLSATAVDSFFVENSNIVELTDTDYILRLDELQIGENTEVQLTKDGSGNLVFQDALVGPTTLTSLKSMRNIWIESLAHAQGNITLSDSTNWAAQYTFISAINVQTTSTDWDLWIHEDASFDIASIRARRIAKTANGSQLIPVNFEVNSSNNNLYLTFTPKTGTHSVSLYITGEARRH